MKETILTIIKCAVLLILVTVTFYTLKDNENTNINKSTNAKLIIFGDNIGKKYSPFIEEGKIYISFDTISQFIDDDIFYDKKANKIIITNQDYVYKFKINDKIATKNLEKFDAGSVWKIENNEPYIDVALIKDIYNIKSQYDDATDTISIDKKGQDDIHLNYNGVKVYSDINTKSDIIETLNMEDTVIVYTESLKHNRWYKIKTDTGKIGYIDKSAVTIRKVEENDANENQNNINKEKLIMFWQYGSSLDTLGEKIEGVNVVMPTWYSLSGNQGEVELKYSKEYYDKAKSYGYEIWPIITNSFDSSKLSPKELTSTIMNDEQKREDLIRNIVDIIKNNKLDGINIDFENMKEEDKYMYTQFLRELYPMVRASGAKLSVDVYFTNYIDRKGVGKACDYLMLMGYDQRGNWSKEAGSIAEVTWTEKNIKSLIEDSKVDSSKIVLGVPFYTRLWTIDKNGEMTTNVYSMKNSQDFISKYNLTKTWDEVAGQNYVETNDKGKTYKLWIEDAESIARRSDLVEKYNLAGITAWQKGFETEDIWNVLYEKIK